LDSIEALFIRKTGAIKPGLERMRSAWNAVGSPTHDIRTILVAGTNGKGTTSGYLASLLKRDGLKVGLYTSPHLIHYRERICIDGELASAASLETTLAYVSSKLGTAFDQLSFFEAMTLTGLQYFADRKPDALILEVGMGGRWDATNVVNPEISVITGIAKDHVQYLGDDLTSIAQEKMGVARVDRPLFWGWGGEIASSSEDFKRSIRNLLKETRARVFERAIHFDAADDSVSVTNRSGTVLKTRTAWREWPWFLQQNASLALAVATYFRDWGDETFAARAQQLKCEDSRFGASLRARFEQRVVKSLTGEPVKVVLDVCHNPDGARALVRSLKEAGRTPVKFLVSMLQDKDYLSTLDILAGHGEMIGFFASDSERTWQRQNIPERFAHVPFYSSAKAAIPAVLASPLKGTLVVCGSVAAMGGVLSYVDEQYEVLKTN